MRFALEAAQQWLQNLSQKVRHDRVSKNDDENFFEIIWLYLATFESKIYIIYIVVCLLIAVLNWHHDKNFNIRRQFQHVEYDMIHAII